MYVVKFCRAPSQLWCGVLEYNGGHIFSAGRTLDDLLRRIKGNAYTATKGQVPNRQVYLDTKQHDTYEFEKLFKVFMSNMFVAKFWRAKDPKKEHEPEMYRTYIKRDDEPKENKPINVTPTERDEHITQIVDGELRVYKLVEVARYKLHTDTRKMPEWPVNLDATKPVLPSI